MNLNWAHRPLSRLVAMAFLPTQCGPKRQKDRITGNPQPCLRAHNVERGRVRDDIGLGTSVIRGSHQGSQSPFIPGRSTQFKPSHLHFTCWGRVDILADTVQSYFTNSTHSLYLHFTFATPPQSPPCLGLSQSRPKSLATLCRLIYKRSLNLGKAILQINLDDKDSLTWE